MGGEKVSTPSFCDMHPSSTANGALNSSGLTRQVPKPGLITFNSSQGAKASARIPPPLLRVYRRTTFLGKLDDDEQFLPRTCAGILLTSCFEAASPRTLHSSFSASSAAWSSLTFGEACELQGRCQDVGTPTCAAKRVKHHTSAAERRGTWRTAGIQQRFPTTSRFSAHQTPLARSKRHESVLPPPLPPLPPSPTPADPEFI